MRELINAIKQKHRTSGIKIFPPATEQEIIAFEQGIGFPLPIEFREFYTTCSGFECDEDIFNVTPLTRVMQYQVDYGHNWFHFAEYMIVSDSWGVRLTEEGQCEIFNGSYPDFVLTSSLKEFLGSFLLGNVFDPGGLYDWEEQKKAMLP